MVLSKLSVTIKSRREGFFHSKVKCGPLTCFKNHVPGYLTLDKYKRLDSCSDARPSAAASPAQGLAAPLCSLASLPPALPVLVNCNRSQGAARVLNTVPGWQMHSKSLSIRGSPENTELALCPRLEPKSLHHCFRFSQNSCRAPLNQCWRN